jgi:hypothetical protein
MQNRIPLSQPKLEQLCILYLRQFSRCRQVQAIALERPATGSANWAVREIQPALSIVATHQARLAIQDLQDVFRMVT